MSEIPPEPPHDPQKFAAYPRFQTSFTHADPARLRALMDGYYGISWVFGLNFLCALMISALGNPLFQDPAEGFGLQLLAMLVTGVLIGIASYFPNKKIAIGKNWSIGAAITASILLAMQSWLCCGIIGYAVIQQIALSEIKKFGVKGGFWGMKKREMEARIRELEASQQVPPASSNT